MPPGPMHVPNAWANRVSSTGVSDSPTTPRTPEIEILRVGIARIINALCRWTGLGLGHRLRATGFGLRASGFGLPTLRLGLRLGASSFGLSGFGRRATP